MKRLLASLVCLLTLIAHASAATVTLGGTNWNTDNAATLTLAPVVPDGNQPQNVQCLICGDNQPQQSATFGYNNFGNKGNVSEYLMFSTATIGGSLLNDQLGTGYSVSFLQAYLASLGVTGFSVGIDVNDTNSAQVLESFYFLNLTQHSVLAAFSPEPGGTAVPSVNNGTGYPDYTLTGFNLAGINQGDQVLFFARWSNANDGPESFFFVPDAQAAVPEPTTWAMMLIGFAGISTVALRRHRRSGRPLLRLT